MQNHCGDGGMSMGHLVGDNTGHLETNPATGRTVVVGDQTGKGRELRRGSSGGSDSWEIVMNKSQEQLAISTDGKCPALSVKALLLGDDMPGVVPGNCAHKHH